MQSALAKEESKPQEDLRASLKVKGFKASGLLAWGKSKLGGEVWRDPPPQGCSVPPWEVHWPPVSLGLPLCKVAVSSTCRILRNSEDPFRNLWFSVGSSYQMPGWEPRAPGWVCYGLWPRGLGSQLRKSAAGTPSPTEPTLLKK